MKPAEKKRLKRCFKNTQIHIMECEKASIIWNPYSFLVYQFLSFKSSNFYQLSLVFKLLNRFCVICVWFLLCWVFFFASSGMFPHLHHFRAHLSRLKCAYVIKLNKKKQCRFMFRLLKRYLSSHFSGNEISCLYAMTHETHQTNVDNVAFVQYFIHCVIFFHLFAYALMLFLPARSLTFGSRARYRLWYSDVRFIPFIFWLELFLKKLYTHSSNTIFLSSNVQETLRSRENRFHCCRLIHS